MDNEIQQDIPAARRTIIYDYICENGSASIKDLALLLTVSEATVRRDLDEMSMEGIIERTRGGAILPAEKSTSFERAYHEKTRLMIEEKKAIGKFASSYVEDGDTIFLDSGTTSLQLGFNLAEKKNITVITYDLFIANSITLDPSSSLIVTGGIRRNEFGVLTGPMVQNFLRDVRVSKVFMTADAIDIEWGISNAGFQEVDIKKQSLISGRYVYLLADHSKFGKVAMAQVCSLHDITEIIVDDGLPVSLQEDLTRNGIPYQLISV